MNGRRPAGKKGGRPRGAPPRGPRGPGAGGKRRPPRRDEGPPLPVVRLKTAPNRADTRLFRKMVARPDERVEPGAMVRIEDRNGRFVGQGFYNPRSEVELRVLTRDERPRLSEAWIVEAVRRAAALRREVLGLDAVTDAYRVVFSESDDLSGLIVDRYADVLSCQVGSLGIHRVFPAIRQALVELFAPRVVHVAADARIAKKEGFPFPDGAGEAARTVVREYGLAFEVDAANGHKTGFFLDQRDARQTVRRLAHGRRVLDLCCYTGGFALNAAKGGARSVVAVDLDENAVAQGRRNAGLNRGLGEVEFVHADAFDHLRALRPGGADLMIVDPAKQATSRDELGGALRVYRDLNELAFSKIARGGLVLTCSCTGLVRMEVFQSVVAEAAERAGRRVRFLEVAGAPPDHPVAADYPQTAYLKRLLVHCP